MGRDRREDDQYLSAVRTSSFSSCGKREEQERCSTADTENVRMLMTLILSCDQFCVVSLQSPKSSTISQNSRSNGEASQRVGIETLRQPLDPLPNSAEGDFTQKAEETPRQGQEARSNVK